jgi:hypothetical protein
MNKCTSCVVISELEMFGKELAMASIEALPWYFPGGTEENYNKPQNNGCPG